MTGKLEIVKFLFKIGGDLNSGDNMGDTPLHIATSNGHTEIVKFIILNVVNKNPENNVGKTPMFYAARHGILEKDGFIKSKQQF